MSIKESIAQYSALPLNIQLRVLARYAHCLTIVARGTYGVEDGVADPSRLREVNEIQHSVIGLICYLADGKKPWCADTDAVLMATDDGDVELQEVFEHALRKTLES